MPNNELATKWLDALRSGAYEQTVGGLHTRAGFCCLGVLCDVKNPEWWLEPHPEAAQSNYLITNPDYDPNDIRDPGDEYESDFQDKVLGGYPPRSLLSEVGLNEDQARTLAELNDNGATFLAIADAIEDMLK
jgi:hypothetical protein